MILNFQSIDTKELEFFGDLGLGLLVWIQNNNILILKGLKLFQKVFISDEEDVSWFFWMLNLTLRILLKFRLFRWNLLDFFHDHLSQWFHSFKGDILDGSQKNNNVEDIYVRCIGRLRLYLNLVQLQNFPELINFLELIFVIFALNLIFFLWREPYHTEWMKYHHEIWVTNFLRG